MNKKIDIYLYRDGFDSKTVNCIHNPIAAAAGAFEINNYFAYCFLYEIFASYTKEDDCFVDFTNRILSELGLHLNVISIENSNSEKVLKLIKGELEKNNPVFIGCKYNALFYNEYYRHLEFKYTHGLIVSAYNDENSTFTINDSSIVRNLFLNSDNSDLYFPLQVEESVILDIFKYSYEQFQNETDYFKIFSDHFFSISKVNELESDFSEIIKKGISLMESSDSVMISEINKYSPNNTEEEFMYDLQEYIRTFVGALQPIFKMLSLYVNKNKEMFDKVDALSKDVEKKRRAIINQFIKNVMQKKVMHDDEKKKMIDEWRKADSSIVDIMKEILCTIASGNKAFSFVDISKYYNNQAFAVSISNDSQADLTGEGTHFLFENVLINLEWKKKNYNFIYNYISEKNDNISCKNQLIPLQDAFITNSIAILGCSEYGSYQETFIITYEDGRIYELKCDFSDFFQLPIYDENIFWTGIALDRKSSKTSVHCFNARLFSKRYNIPEGIIKSIELPDRKNVHIFAITLEH